MAVKRREPVAPYMAPHHEPRSHQVIPDAVMPHSCSRLEQPHALTPRQDRSERVRPLLGQSGRRSLKKGYASSAPPAVPLGAVVSNARRFPSDRRTRTPHPGCRQRPGCQQHLDPRRQPPKWRAYTFPPVVLVSIAVPRHIRGPLEAGYNTVPAHDQERDDERSSRPGCFTNCNFPASCPVLKSCTPHLERHSKIPDNTCRKYGQNYAGTRRVLRLTAVPATPRRDENASRMR
jgi:hypothetical protein